ncbi:hypothetical protein [Streptomyces sp. VRA16 Mangrove soil]|uniref:hypothetical protein n=1 Tax=Streptomyces sp. VRA16 Mangrove soil TaxID=2817434 RepID=UPI001A9DCA8A|nr:hypothetical protein [Streptomyces sp. VRA16 Mangrove soil]MBO1337252.1 hypothetical protein [Streptomyces sp. VRA16 Mangrove soil]
MIVELSASVARGVAGSFLSNLLRDLLRLQTEQVKQLEELKQDVKRLTEGPWRRARLYIEDASCADDSEWLLRQALAALMEAYSLELEPGPRRPPIAADVALIQGMLGDVVNARRWAWRAFIDQREVVGLQIPKLLKGGAKVWYHHGEIWILRRQSDDRVLYEFQPNRKYPLEAVWRLEDHPDVDLHPRMKTVLQMVEAADDYRRACVELRGGQLPVVSLLVDDPWKRRPIVEWDGHWYI